MACAKSEKMFGKIVESAADYRMKGEIKNSQALSTNAQETYNLTDEAAAVFQYRGQKAGLKGTGTASEVWIVREGSMEKFTPQSVGADFIEYRAPPKPGEKFGGNVKIPKDVNYVIKDTAGQPKYFVAENKVSPAHTEYTMYDATAENLHVTKTVKTKITVDTTENVTIGSYTGNSTKYALTDGSGNLKGTVEYLDLNNRPPILEIRNAAGKTVCRKVLSTELKGNSELAIGTFRNDVHGMEQTFADYNIEANNTNRLATAGGAGTRTATRDLAKTKDAGAHGETARNISARDDIVKYNFANDPVGQKYFDFIDTDGKILGAYGKEYGIQNFTPYAEKVEAFYGELAGNQRFPILSSELKPKLAALQAKIEAGVPIPELKNEFLELHNMATKDFSNYALNKQFGVHGGE